jgi:hypothetical protein
MDIVNFSVSNRATFLESFQWLDEDGVAVTLTGATIVYEVRKPGCTTPELSATTSGGEITIVTTTMTIRFEETEMDDMDAGDYEHGCTIMLSGETEVEQAFTGKLTVIDGIVS